MQRAVLLLQIYLDYTRNCHNRHRSLLARIAGLTSSLAICSSEAVAIAIAPCPLGVRRSNYRTPCLVHYRTAGAKRAMPSPLAI